jgi:hypothetical protein
MQSPGVLTQQQGVQGNGFIKCTIYVPANPVFKIVTFVLKPDSILVHSISLARATRKSMPAKSSFLTHAFCGIGYQKAYESGQN